MKVLPEIVARKKIDVAARMKAVPFGELKPSRSTRSFFDALSQSGSRFIFECKKASPSEGLIRPDFDLKKIAEIYRSVADAISVLADEPFFQGSLNNVRIVSELTGKPVLCKDFIVEPYQVAEARCYGANAVLLMLSVLDDETYKTCADLARSLNMDYLTETHDEEELERALKLGAPIIGINNRNLKTMKVDLETTPRLARRIPKGKLIVCESGIRTHADIERLSKYADAFLIGSTMMHEARLDLAARALIYGRVKICGLTSVEDARAAYEAGASFGGLIFAKESPRCVDEATAQAIAKEIPGLSRVGVFVNESLEEVSRLARQLNLSAVQLHGDETKEFVEALRGKLAQASSGKIEIWKAIPVRAGRDIPLLKDTGADRLVLDTYSKDVRGGSGKTFDWKMLEHYPDKNSCLIAGGIAPDNAAEAMRTGAYAIDVNSGVESSPGKKNRDALKELFQSLRTAKCC